MSKLPLPSRVCLARPILSCAVTLKWGTSSRFRLFGKIPAGAITLNFDLDLKYYW